MGTREPAAPKEKSATDREAEQWALGLFARLVMWIGLPTVVLAGIHALRLGYVTPFVGAEVATVLVLAVAALAFRNRLDRFKPILVGGMLLVSLFGMLHFGPNFGAALVFAVALMLTSFFYGARGAAVTLVLGLAGLWLNALVFAETSWARPPAIPDNMLGWVRLSVTTVLCGLGIAWGFLGLLALLRRSSRAEAEAMARERAAQKESELALQSYSTSQRLESVGRLAGGVSHDVNNALTIVMSGANALRSAGLSAKEQTEIIDEIDAAARAAAATTRQLVAFSRGLPDEGGPADAAAVIEAIAKSLSRLFPENIRVVKELAACRRTAMAEGMLTQVLLNLALNARDACEAGGTVTLSCEEVGDDVVIRVTDDGVGIDEETRERVFEPFFTTKEGEGSGMGLPMVKAAVTRYGGTVAIQSEPGSGSTFELTIPTAKAVAVSPPAPTKIHEVPHSAHILLVEDQPQLLRAMSRELRMSGFSVTSTSCVSEAKAAIEDTEFDLLCTDGLLPDGRAHDVIAALVERDDREVPVVVCSGYLPDELALEELSDVTFVRKPYAPGELVAAVETRLANAAEAP